MQQFLRHEGFSGLRIDPVVPRYAAVADDAVTGLFSSQRNALQDFFWYVKVFVAVSCIFDRVFFVLIFAS